MPGEVVTGLVLHPLVGARDWEGEESFLLRGIDGRILAEVQVAPPLLVQLALRRAADSAGPPVQASVLAEAGRIFASETLAGESPEEYCRNASLATGVPRGVYIRALGHIAEGLARMHDAVAAELPAPSAHPRHAVRWTRRARTLGVVAPSNHPETHLSWARAVAVGYGVVVRPGGRDPFTPLRLARALYAAGLEPDRVSVLTGEHDVADSVVKYADLALVYGGPDAQTRWAGRKDVVVRGPGHSKVLLRGGAPDAALAHVAHTAVWDGGVRCANTSLVLTDGDPAEVADRLAARLAGLPLVPILDVDAALPAFDAERARRLVVELDRLVAGGLRRHPSNSPQSHQAIEAADGSWVMPPVVLSTDDPDHPALGIELPFPFVVVAPWSRDSGSRPLRDSLVVTVFDTAPQDDRHLVEQLASEPTVRRVVVGQADPWESSPGLPHDGSLTHFLLEPKAVIYSEER